MQTMEKIIKKTPSSISFNVSLKFLQPQWCQKWLILIWRKSRPVSMVLFHVRVSSSAFRHCLFCGHGELNECSQIIQTEDVTHAGVRRWTQSDLGGVHMRFRHAPLTSQTMPPLPHSQSNGVHSQIPSSLKPRLRDPNTTRLTVPFLLDWTSILPPRLLKTEPPTDATPCLLIY